jgi:putative Mn2+ efflux pump MntP
LSIDNLVVGLALGAFKVIFAVAALVNAVVSVAMSLVGVEIGCRLGTRFEPGSEIAGGVVLIAIGCALGFGLVGRKMSEPRRGRPSAYRRAQALQGRDRSK